MLVLSPLQIPVPRTTLGWVPYLWKSVLFPGQADSDLRVRLRSLAILLALPALLLYPMLGHMLFEPDEGRYAQIPNEMYQRGEWVVPRLQGEPYLDKPPLLYWLVKISYSIFGVSEAAARLVPALSVHLTILFVYLIGRRSIGERGAFWAALLLSLAPGYIGVARILVLDGLLTLCITTSVLCAFEAVRTGQLKIGWWVAAAFASGLGFLTKGPISEVLLFPPLYFFALLNGTNARVGLRALFAFMGIVIAVNMPWYVAIYAKQPEFLKYFFWEHNVMRFLRPFDHLQPVWYYAPIILSGFLPGVLIAVSYVQNLFLGDTGSSPRRSPAGGFWLLSGLWCLFFFSLSGSKLPTYILPAFPPLCLALGEFVARSDWKRATFFRIGIAVFLALNAFLILGFVPWYARERSPMGKPETIAHYVSDPSTPVFTYPRHIDSVAFYTGRHDLQTIRTKEINQFIVDCHFRARTVVLFTHDHSLGSFREALPPSLKVTETISLRRPGNNAIDKALGGGPWGLCDIAVIEPVALQHR